MCALRQISTSNIDMDVEMHTLIPVKHPRFSQTSKITGQRPVFLFCVLTAATLLAFMTIQLSPQVVSPSVTSLNENAIGAVPLPTPKPSKAEIAAILAARDAHRALATGTIETPLTANQ